MRVPANFSYYLGMHKSCRERDLILAEKLDALEVELSRDRRVIRIRKMVYDVQREAHRMRGFVRLKPAGSALQGYMKPEHGVGLHVAAVLAKRFPGTAVVLGNELESWAAIFRDGRVLWAAGGPLDEEIGRIKQTKNWSDDTESTGVGPVNMGPVNLEQGAIEPVKGRPGDGGRDDGGTTEEVWEAYYNSQYCSERRNLATFHKKMPRKALASAGLRVERNTNEVTLDDFF